MEAPIISLDHVSKYFRLYGSPKDRLLEALHPAKKEYHTKHWALRDLSLEIRRGEFLGILGRNGCGKSTLLKLISGVLGQSAGTISVNGKISALLELGSGMNPEFSGRENIYFYGTILGLDRDAVDAKLDEILSFADIGEYVDQPIKRYSSGMKARLAFAVSTCIVPEILIIDEVLAVGDIFFRQKCHKRIEELVAGDVTVLLVSHALEDIARYCSRAIFLNDGGIQFDGGAKEATTFYQRCFRAVQGGGRQNVRREPLPTLKTDPSTVVGQRSATTYLPGWELPSWPGGAEFVELAGRLSVGVGWVRCLRVAVCDVSGRSESTFPVGAWLCVYYEFEALQDLDVPFGILRLETHNNILVHGKDTYQNPCAHPSAIAKGTILRFEQQIRLDVRPGQYSLGVGVNMFGHSDYAGLKDMSRAEIQASFKQLDFVDHAAIIVVVESRGPGVLAHRHWGLCDLPGSSRVGVLSDAMAGGSRPG